MQAYIDRALLPISRNDLPAPQQSHCSRQPGVTSQSGYYGQQTTLNQWNAPQPLGINSGNSFNSTSPHNSSSPSLQSSPVCENLPSPQQTFRQLSPPAQSGSYNVQQRTLQQWNTSQSLGLSTGNSCHPTQPKSSLSHRNDLPGQQHPVTLNCTEPGPTSQTAYYNMQQNLLAQWNNLQSRGLVKGQYLNNSTQPSSAYWQSHPTPQVQQTGPHHQTLHRAPAAFRAPYRAAPAHHKATNINLSHYKQLQHNIPQDYAKVHYTAPSNYQPLSKRQSQPPPHRTQTLHQTADQPQKCPNVTVSQAPPLISVIRKVRNGDWAISAGRQSQPPPHRARPVSSHGQSQHEVNPTQSVAPQNHLYHRVTTEQFGNLSSASSLPQPQFLGPYETSLSSIPANPCSTEPQGTQSNGTSSVLTGTSLDATSSTSPVAEAPDSNQCKQIKKLLHYLLQDDELQGQGRGPPLSYSSHLTAQAATLSRSGHQPPTATYTASVMGHSQAKASVLNSSAPPNPTKREVSKVGPAHTKGPGISVDENAPSRTLKAAMAEMAGAKSTKLQKSRSDWQMSEPQEVEHCTDQAECVELVLALQRAVRQVHRAVAVVPPISQQADPVLKDITTTADDSLPFKVDVVWTLAKDSKPVEMGSDAPGTLEEINKELLELHSIPKLQTQESCTTSKSLRTSKATVGLMATEGPEQQNNDQNVEPGTDNGTFDLSTVPVTDFTLESLQRLVKSLEATSAEECEKETVTDVAKCALDLYWDGNIRNLEIEREAAGWTKTVAEICIKENQDVVLQSLEPKNFKRLSCNFHVLEEVGTLPTNEFCPPWLKVLRELADIDKVLAEPLSDHDSQSSKDASQTGFDRTINYVDYKAQLSENDAEDLDVANQTSETVSEHNVSSDTVPLQPEHSEEVLTPETMVCQNDITQEEVVKTDPCVERSSPSKQETSKKQDSPHHMQSNQLQDFMQSCEAPVGLNENNETECEDHRDRRKADSPKSTIIDLTGPNTHMPPGSPIPTLHLSPFDQHVEKDDLCEERDSSTNDVPIVDIVLLSSDDVSTIFKDCDEQEESVPLCQEDPKTIPSLSQPDNLSGKSSVQSHGSPSSLKFTCPHVANINCSADYLCPKCWEETPLLEVGLDELLFSSKKGGPTVMSSPIIIDDESCSPLPDKQTEEVTEPLFKVPEPVLVTPKGDGSEIPKAPAKPWDGKPNPCPQPNLLPVETCQPVDPKNTKPVPEENHLIKSSASADIPKALTCIENPEKANLSLTKTLTQSVSSQKYLPYKKLLLSKTGAMFSKDHVRPAFVLNKAASHKQGSAHHSFTSTTDGQGSKKKKKKKRKKEHNCSRMKRTFTKDKHSSQTETHAYRTNVSVKPQLPSVAESTRPKNGPECSPPSDARQKRDLKVKFLLYGSQNGDRDFQHYCNDRQKPCSVPLYISVAADSTAGRSYTDAPSAKQKVYKQWLSSFGKKRKTGLCKKWQKDSEIELKNRIEIQKKVMRERALLVKEKNQLGKGQKRKNDGSSTQEPKNLKSRRINEYFA